MPGTLNAADSITNIAASKRCYEGASARGQLQFPRGGQGWAQFSLKICNYTQLGPAATLAMGFTECCAEYGRGMVFWMVKGNNTIRRVQLPWTLTTAQLPSLLYVDFVWDDATKDEWLKSPHWTRLDRLNARAGALNLEALTMPITLIFEVDNYDNVRIDAGLAPVSLTYNSSGYTYLGFTADMASHMRFLSRASNEAYWQAPKNLLTQFMMASGPMVAARLRSMYREARPETLWFLRSLIKEAIKGHNEWVANGGYTVEGDRAVGPDLARKFEEALRQQQRRRLQQQQPQPQQRQTPQEQPGERLQELRNITGQWSINKRGTLQNYIDVMNTGVVADVSRFILLDEVWTNNLSHEDKVMAMELWELEDENDLRAIEIGDQTDGPTDTRPSNTVRPNEMLGRPSLSAGLPHAQGLASAIGTIRRTLPTHTRRRQAISNFFGGGSEGTDDSQPENISSEGWQSGMDLD